MVCPNATSSFMCEKHVLPVDPFIESIPLKLVHDHYWFTRDVRYPPPPQKKKKKNPTPKQHKNKQQPPPPKKKNNNKKPQPTNK